VPSGHAVVSALPGLSDAPARARRGADPRDVAGPTRVPRLPPPALPERDPRAMEPAAAHPALGPGAPASDEAPAPRGGATPRGAGASSARARTPRPLSGARPRRSSGSSVTRARSCGHLLAGGGGGREGAGYCPTEYTMRGDGRPQKTIVERRRYSDAARPQDHARSILGMAD